MCLGIPGEIVEVLDEQNHLGKVDIDGVRRTVNLMLVTEESDTAQDLIGTWVLVHVGFAMARIDPAEAERTLQLLNEMGDVQAELDAMKDSDEGKIGRRGPHG